MKRIIISEHEVNELVKVWAHKSEDSGVQEFFDPTSSLYAVPRSLSTLLHDVPEDFHLVSAMGQVYIFEQDIHE